MSSCTEQIAEGKEPSDACLAAAARHIAHDLDLFEEAWTQRGTRLGWTMWFILARSLDDFFFRYERKRNRDGDYQDDILAVDFPLRGAWEPFARGLRETAKALPEYEAVRHAANKNGAHLTYTRTDDDAPSNIAPSSTVHSFLVGVSSEWLGRLKPEARVWFGSRP